MESEIEELLHESVGDRGDDYLVSFAAVPDTMKPAKSEYQDLNNSHNSYTTNSSSSTSSSSTKPQDTTSQLLGESINTNATDMHHNSVNTSNTNTNEYDFTSSGNSTSGASLSSDAQKLLGTYPDDHVLIESESESESNGSDGHSDNSESDGDYSHDDISDDDYFEKNIITELST